MDDTNAQASAASALPKYNFFGSHTHSIDEKGRIIIPNAYREALGETFSIGPTRSFDGAALYPTAVFDQMLAEFNSLNPRDVEVQAYRSFFSSFSVRDMQTDGQGRILIPQKIRGRFLQDAQEVEISGNTDFIRIMDAAKAAKLEESFFENLPTILEKLGHLDPKA